jgi:hypothetical protein
MLRRKIGGDGLIAVANAFAVALLPAASDCPDPSFQIAKKIFVGAYWHREPKFVAAGFFIKRHFNPISGSWMMENVNGFFHTKLSQALTKASGVIAL